MTRVQLSSISDHILSVYKHPDDFNDAELYREVKHIVDVIKILTPSQGIDYTANALYDELLYLRLSFLSKQSYLNDFFSKFETIVVEEITNSHYEFNSLAKAKADCLELYFKVAFTDLTKNLIINTAENIKQLDLPKKPYSSLVAEYKNQPTADIDTFLTYLTSSLNVDFCLITADLILSNEVIVDEIQIDILIKKMETSIIDYAFLLSYFIKTWQPDEDDDAELTLKVRHKIEDFEFKTGIRSISREDYHRQIEQSRQEIKEGKKVSLNDL